MGGCWENRGAECGIAADFREIAVDFCDGLWYSRDNQQIGSDCRRCYDAHSLRNLLRRNASYAPTHDRRAASYVQASQERSHQLSVHGCCKCRVGDNAVANARVTATSATASPNRVCDSAPNARALRQLAKGRCRADHENVTCAGRRAVLFYTGSAGRRLAGMEWQR